MNNNYISILLISCLVCLALCFSGCDSGSNNANNDAKSTTSTSDQNTGLSKGSDGQVYIQMDNLKGDFQNNEQIMDAIKQAKAQGATVITLNPDQQQPVMASKPADNTSSTVVQVETQTHE